MTEKLDLETSALKSLAGIASTSPVDAVHLLDDTGLDASDFADGSRAALFAAIVAAAKDGRAPDAVALVHLTKGMAPKELVVNVVTGAEFGNAAERFRLVKESSARRKTQHAFKTLLTSLQNKDVSLEQCISEARATLEAFVSPTAQVRALDQDVLELQDTIEQVQNGYREPVLETGIEALDHVIGGLKQTLIIVGALPGIGKSALMASIIRNLTGRGVRVGLLSLEDPARWITKRILAEESGVPVFLFEQKRLTASQLQKVHLAAPVVHEKLRHLVADDRNGLDIAAVVASARRMVAMGCKAIFVDHLGEIRLERSDRHDLEIARALQELRGLAKTYRVPVVVACHLKRRDGMEAETVPRLTDFAFSAAVERMARVALGLFRTKEKKLGVAVLKQTEGPAGGGFSLEPHPTSGMISQSPATPNMQTKLAWGDM